MNSSSNIINIALLFGLTIIYLFLAKSAFAFCSSQNYPLICYPSATEAGCSQNGLCMSGEKRYDVTIRTPANDFSCSGRSGGAVYAYSVNVYCCVNDCPVGCGCVITPTPIITPGGSCPYWCATSAQCSAAGGAVHGEYTCSGSDICCEAGSSCFLPGTKIKTPNGEKNIEEIKKGDKVVSYIPQTPKETIQNTVKEPYSVTRDHFYEIETLSGKIIRATDEHPFYIGFEKQKKTSTEKIKSLFNISYIYFSDGWQEIKEKIWR